MGCKKKVIYFLPMVRTFRLLKIIWWYKISKMCQTFFCWNAICRLLHFWNSDSKIVSDVHPMSEGWRIIQSCQICDVFVVVFVVVADVVVQAEQTITKNACVRTRRFQPLEKYWKWKKKIYWTKKLFVRLLILTAAKKLISSDSSFSTTALFMCFTAWVVESSKSFVSSVEHKLIETNIFRIY